MSWKYTHLQGNTAVHLIRQQMDGFGCTRRVHNIGLSASRWTFRPSQTVPLRLTKLPSSADFFGGRTDVFPARLENPAATLSFSHTVRLRETIFRLRPEHESQGPAQMTVLHAALAQDSGNVPHPRGGEVKKVTALPWVATNAPRKNPDCKQASQPGPGPRWFRHALRLR